MLDTNIVSDLVKRPNGKIAGLISTVGETEVCTSIIVAAELRFGAAKKQSPRLTAQLDAVLAAMDVIALETPVDAVYGSIRAELERIGQPNGGNDLLIAAQAIALDLTLVTDNEREFSRVDSLRVENWIR